MHVSVCVGQLNDKSGEFGLGEEFIYKILYISIHTYTKMCTCVCVCSWTFGQRVQSGCKFTVCLPSFALCPFCCQYNKIGQASVKWLPRPMYLKVGMSQQTAAKPIQWMQRSAQMQKSCDDYADKVTTVSISIKNKTIRLVIFLVCRKNKKITYVLCFSALKKKKRVFGRCTQSPWLPLKSGFSLPMHSGISGVVSMHAGCARVRTALFQERTAS